MSEDFYVNYNDCLYNHAISMCVFRANYFNYNLSTLITCIDSGNISKIC